MMIYIMSECIIIIRINACITSISLRCGLHAISHTYVYWNGVLQIENSLLPVCGCVQGARSKKFCMLGAHEPSLKVSHNGLRRDVLQ